MKVLFLFFLLVSCSSLAWATDLSQILTPEGKYITKYDNIDIDNIFKVSRLLNSYVDCLKGLKCTTKQGQFLKGMYV